MSKFDFNIGNKNAAIIKLNRVGLGFNRHAVEKLGNPPYIAIGIDKENKKIAVKPLDKEDSDFYSFKFARNIKVQNVRIHSVQIRNALMKILNISLLKEDVALYCDESEKNLLTAKIEL